LSAKACEKSNENQVATAKVEFTKFFSRRDSKYRYNERAMGIKNTL